MSAQGQTRAPDAAAIEALARAAMARLPEAFARHLDGVILRIDEFPEDDVLDEMGIDSPFDLLGLYTGRPIGQKSVSDIAPLPDMIHLYRRPLIEEWVETGESLEALVYEKTRQLVQSERLAAIGQTIATLAHAIKNIIGGLTGGMFVLEKGMELSNEEYRAQGWEMLKGNVAKIKNLSLGLLNYAKDREPDFQLCDPNESVREVFNLMLPRAKDAGVKLKMELAEDLKKWFKEKWVRFGPDGKIRGDCARGSSKEGKPKCLPQSKAHALGKKGRASAASRKRRQDPNPERSGSAINVPTRRKKS